MIAAGLIDRAGDRKPLADWVRKRIKPQVDLFIDTEHLPPFNKGWDIVPRVKYIVEEAKKAKVDFLYLVENDDYYPKDYIKRMEKVRQDADFINSYLYVRYNVGSQLLQLIGHQKGGYFIGGLWTMGFKPEILSNYFWQRIVNDEIRDLDGEISKFAQSKDINDVWFNDHHGVGVKGHGIGMVKKTGPHKAFNLPYMQDNGSMLSTLTDKSFMELHGFKYVETSKTNDQLRKELKQLFRMDEEILTDIRFG